MDEDSRTLNCNMPSIRSSPADKRVAAWDSASANVGGLSNNTTAKFKSSLLLTAGLSWKSLGRTSITIRDSPRATPRHAFQTATSVSPEIDPGVSGLRHEEDNGTGVRPLDCSEEASPLLARRPVILNVSCVAECLAPTTNILAGSGDPSSPEGGGLSTYRSPYASGRGLRGVPDRRVGASGGGLTWSRSLTVARRPKDGPSMVR